MFNRYQATPLVHSMHWDNISKDILHKQKMVFDALKIPLIQCNANNVEHGTWMNSILASCAEDEILVFSDIDAFPLNQDAYYRAVDAAQKGKVFGLAQFSNHKKTKEIYAGPMFMSFSKKTWRALGCPTLERSRDYDAAESLSFNCRTTGSPLELVFPTSTLIPKWALSDRGIFGIGTFYGDCEFFHLFESRKPKYESIFIAIAEDVTNGRPLNFEKYLSISLSENESNPAGTRRNWIPKPLRRFL